MYIEQIDIKSFRSIHHFKAKFDSEEQMKGWHVVIGENGSGKTSLLRAIAIGLMDIEAFTGLWINPVHLIQVGKEIALIELEIRRDKDLDILEEFIVPEEVRNAVFSGPSSFHLPEDSISFKSFLEFKRTEKGSNVLFNTADGVRPVDENYHPTLSAIIEQGFEGWFGVGFGVERKFQGGDQFFKQFYLQNDKAARLMSLFKEISFSAVEPWLQKLKMREHEGHGYMFECIVKLVNNDKDPLLPGGVRIQKVSSEGVFMVDDQGVVFDWEELSDGYRSMLSLTMELIRQMTKTYGEEKVFGYDKKGSLIITPPGVVLIDEIDAHLHPTWQTRIGQWFTRNFPRLQFIVTTHSPLICRACGEHGKIFRLAAPGSEHESGEITGVERDRLVYGDILDAYATEEFGEGIERGIEGEEKRKAYRALVYKERYGEAMTEEEKAELKRLNAIFSFNVEGR
jgi:AAA domain, putative AbiEii toxin, Type IV TA system/Protein of unknown function (DUF2813)